MSKIEKAGRDKDWLRYDGQGAGLATKYGVLCPRTAQWFTQRNEGTLNIAIAFVPWIIMQSYFEGTLNNEDTFVAHRGEGAVVFSDASGFTKLTEQLAQKSNGAELLSDCLKSFFTPLIDIINSYRGDVIKFSGDALTIYFPAVDDTLHPSYNAAVPPHGTYGLRDLGPMATSVLRASACCIQIHRRLHMFETNVDGVVFCLHIGVGCGSVTILQVGGIVPPESKHPRYEYVIAGNPVEQISVAEPLAKNGETCLSPQAWRYAADWALEGRKLGTEPPNSEYHILENLNASQYTFPCVRNAAVERDMRHLHKFTLQELHVIRRYIPSNVFKQIENDTLTYVNEMRTISTIFISGSGVDVSSEQGARVAQELVTDVQRVCYAHEGSLNKYLIDDKGMLLLLVYGLPPMVHTDDPTRAVLACLDIVEIFKRMDLVCGCGVSTGRNYCGVVGSALRMEYTVLGDTVNLAARLMGAAGENGVLTDECTRERAEAEIEWTKPDPIKVKGKSNLIQIYRPARPSARPPTGLLMDKTVNFPWVCMNSCLGGKSRLTEVAGWDAKQDLKRILDGPRRSGGLIVISGETGLGTTELTELTVTETLELGALPVFTTKAARPGPKFRPVQELLRSIVQSFRHLEMGLPGEEKAALAVLADSQFREFIDDMQPDLSMPCSLWYRGSPTEANAVGQGIDLALRLLRRLLQDKSVTCVVSLRSGSNMFSSEVNEEDLEELPVIWALLRQLAEMAEDLKSRSAPNPLLVILSMKLTKDACPQSVRRFMHQDAFIRIAPLTDNNILEYVSRCLGLPVDKVPSVMHRYVAKITQGNALFISETIEQLQLHGHIEVVRAANGTAEQVRYSQDLELINVANWTATAMVGGTMCMLESLEPLQTVVVKMATVFHGVFTIADLGASSCSRWAGATFFDAFRLFYAVAVLVRMGILERVTAEDSKKLSGFPPDPSTECYRLNNMLIRKVGDMLVLEAQRKTVKRQALVDRVLQRDMPEKMDELRRKKAIPHVPWYYQIDHPETPKRHSRG